VFNSQPVQLIQSIQPSQPAQSNRPTQSAQTTQPVQASQPASAQILKASELPKTIAEAAKIEIQKNESK